MPKIHKEKLKKLYNKGLSIKDIADREKLPYSFVRYWMTVYKIPRRSWSEATYVKRNPDGDPFEIKINLSRREAELKNLGLGIYWGEGDKSPNNTSVRIGNIDPFLLKKFREFLRKIYTVREEKLKYNLILFNDVDESIAVDFWEKHLDIKRHQLGKITIIPPQGKGTYKRKSQFGVLIVIFTNKKLKDVILGEIKNIGTPM